MPESPLIAPSGELDITSIARFRTALDTFALGSRGPLVIDLSALSFIDSTGLGALFEIHDRFRREERDLCLVAPQGSVAADLLARTGFLGRMRIFESRPEALQHLGGGEPSSEACIRASLEAEWSRSQGGASEDTR